MADADSQIMIMSCTRGRGRLVSYASEHATKVAARSSGMHIRAWHAGAYSLPCMFVRLCLPPGVKVLLSVSNVDAATSHHGPKRAKRLCQV